MTQALTRFFRVDEVRHSPGDYSQVVTESCVGALGARSVYSPSSEPELTL